MSGQEPFEGSAGSGGMHEGVGATPIGPDYLEHGGGGSAGVDVPRPRRAKRAALIGGTAVAVLAASGAAVAYGALSGGGAQPEDVLPASALALRTLE